MKTLRSRFALLGIYALLVVTLASVLNAGMVRTPAPEIDGRPCTQLYQKVASDAEKQLCEKNNIVRYAICTNAQFPLPYHLYLGTFKTVWIACEDVTCWDYSKPKCVWSDTDGPSCPCPPMPPSGPSPGPASPTDPTWTALASLSSTPGIVAIILSILLGGAIYYFTRNNNPVLWTAIGLTLMGAGIFGYLASQGNLTSAPGFAVIPPEKIVLKDAYAVIDPVTGFAFKSTQEQGKPVFAGTVNTKTAIVTEKGKVFTESNGQVKELNGNLPEGTKLVNAHIDGNNIIAQGTVNEQPTNFIITLDTDKFNARTEEMPEEIGETILNMKNIVEVGDSIYSADVIQSAEGNDQIVIVKVEENDFTKVSTASPTAVISLQETNIPDEDEPPSNLVLGQEQVRLNEFAFKIYVPKESEVTVTAVRHPKELTRSEAEYQAKRGNFLWQETVRNPTSKPIIAMTQRSLGQSQTEYGHVLAEVTGTAEQQEYTSRVLTREDKARLTALQREYATAKTEQEKQRALTEAFAIIKSQLTRTVTENPQTIENVVAIQAETEAASHTGASVVDLPSIQSSTATLFVLASLALTALAAMLAFMRRN